MANRFVLADVIEYSKAAFKFESRSVAVIVVILVPTGSVSETRT